MSKKVLFIDRDGTLIAEPPDTFQVDTLEQLSFLPGVIRNLYRIVRETDYELVMVSNQDGLGTEQYPEERFNLVQEKMLEMLRNEDITFSAVHIDRSFAHEQKPTRKPGTAMLEGYRDGQYDLEHSFVIGDRITDIQLAENLGCSAIFLRNYEDPGNWGQKAALIAGKWEDIYDFLLRQSRVTCYKRLTTETDINIRMRLDGSGRYQIDTGIGFFNHMLEQLSRHSMVDLDIKARGDLHIDEHHTVEDTAIALGTAFAQALGNKAGIGRYGFCLPMDDCLAQVALDLGGRPWLVWEADFRREKIGDMPTELFSHFFKSFSDAARCNIHVRADGSNEHHKIEAIFKAFARSLRMAIQRENGQQLPSTKGIL